jgi:hypothetical protein
MISLTTAVAEEKPVDLTGNSASVVSGAVLAGAGLAGLSAALVKGADGCSTPAT